MKIGKATADHALCENDETLSTMISSCGHSIELDFEASLARNEITMI
jgi:hypothetical protein